MTHLLRNQLPRVLRVLVLLAPVLLAFVGMAGAQDEATGTSYQTPPQVLVDLVDAPLIPLVSVSPDHQWVLLMERPSLPSIAELAQPELRLAGLRINPRTNGPSRSRYVTGLRLKQIQNGKEKVITGLPDHARIDEVTWSPDGTHIAFSLEREDRTELWAADVESGRARRLVDAQINAAYARSFAWLADSHTLICKVIPPERGVPPEESLIPSGPVVRQNLGKKAPARTYQDLLRSPYGEVLFEHYATAQVVRVTLEGEAKSIGAAGIIRELDPAPNGKLLLVTTIHRPYSYLVPIRRFPYRVEVWDLDGNVVHQVADLPLAEGVPIPFGSVPTGPRNFGWRADAPATLYWVEALDGGDAGKKAEVRDRVFLLPTPFTGEPQRLITLGLRYSGINWSDDNVALISEFWRRTRRTRTWIVQPGAPEVEPRVLFDRSTEDRYSDPGRPLTRRNNAGRRVLLTANDGKRVFLSSLGASPEGNRPFLDRLDLTTGETTRLWRSEAPHYERVVELLDNQGQVLLTSRESVTEPPNYFLRNLVTNGLQQLTDFPHPTPQLKDVHKELIKYQRADGVQLTATLYLPPGYQPKQGPLPMLMWAYPREYKSADAAGQVRDSPYRFVRPSPTSPLMFLALGYAVFDNPTMPIIGEGDTEPNDTYVEQLVASAKAAVEEVVHRGIADRDRIAIGGHSYGAFMVANLLAHSDLFAAGIARSGAYNRTLTPFGFQAEQRTFWQAPEIYFKMSPFMHAQKSNEPILLIHGMADSNSGTFPIQSQRLYGALKGHGATVRLVMLPHESHGYRARESVLHTLWETGEWLDKYLAEK